MKDLSSLVYSASAVRRILGVASSAIVTVKIWWKVIWVCVRGCRPTLISKKLFKSEFVDRRKAAGAKLLEERKVEATQSATVFEVATNSHPQGFYYVTLGSASIGCQCDDYKNQTRTREIGCCKHGYAVLGLLGCASLADYVGKMGEAIKQATPVVKAPRGPAPQFPRVNKLDMSSFPNAPVLDGARHRSAMS